MSIVSVEVESVHGGTSEKRFIFYRCQDDAGEWHSYGPIITNDPSFDIEATKQTVATKVSRQLADREANNLLE